MKRLIMRRDEAKGTADMGQGENAEEADGSGITRT
jgi:hypothetical protein